MDIDGLPDKIGLINVYYTLKKGLEKWKKIRKFLENLFLSFLNEITYSPEKDHRLDER